MKQFDLVCCVVNRGGGTHILGLAKRHGVHGGTICVGRGTAHRSKLLDFLEMTDVRREIVLMLTEHTSAREAMLFLAREMSFHKRNSGICFSVPVKDILGIRNLTHVDLEHQEAQNEAMYNAIFTIVEKGLAENVVDAAVSAGARGGTIINARGSGIHEIDTVFSMPIEPEREMVMILASRDLTDGIAQAIRTQLHIDEEGKGILFVLGVNEAHGLY
ncbi:MAG: P-II family nitrogen regulator [Oscillospiraceae bacterium]|jgi:nitrogen regulatory protein PII|nr:P-II family nitrogen regulator [Oscillospiraceae bacterium]